jgi:hypothetical protein
MMRNLFYAIFLIILAIFLYFFFIGWKTEETLLPIEENTAKKTEFNVPTITEQNIREEYFTGKRPVISGESNLVLEANKYIENRVAEFKRDADEQVPDIRKQFGEDVASANYVIEITAKYLTSDSTESIVIGESAYTGGASTNSAFRVITTNRESGQILSLSDIIKPDQKTNFTNLVKKALKAWRPDGTAGIVVFETEVDNLNFNSFMDWSLDQNNLILYFDKYEIGPGALGAVIFPISKQKIKEFLNLSF